MKLSTRGRYAVMAIVDLARHHKERPVSLAEIAERQEISLSYLEQLFHKLKQNNIVESVRGARGGYLLGRDAHEITIAEVILAVDEPLQTTRCMPGQNKGCMATGERCVVHHLWEDLGDHIRTYLDGITLAKVLYQFDRLGAR